MALPEDGGNNWWPSVADQKGAKKAAKEGAGAAVVVAAITTLFSVLALFDIRLLPGYSAWSFVDAALFALVAWRIYKMSRVWAVVGLLLYIVEFAYTFYLRGISAGIFVGVLILGGFVSGVRGTFALRRLLASQLSVSDGLAQPVD